MRDFDSFSESYFLSFWEELFYAFGEGCGVFGEEAVLFAEGYVAAVKGVFGQFIIAVFGGFQFFHYVGFGRIACPYHGFALLVEVFSYAEVVIG